MARREDGFFEAFIDGAVDGALYRFALSDGMLVPDLASRFQPLAGAAAVCSPDDAVTPRIGVSQAARARVFFAEGIRSKSSIERPVTS
jgi:1,4-alpha-glucan branching enzyme